MFNPLKRSGKKEVKKPDKTAEPETKKNLLTLNDEEVKTTDSQPEEITDNTPNDEEENIAKIQTETTQKEEVLETEIDVEKTEEKEDKDIVKHTTTYIPEEEVPKEYQADLPASLSQDLADLAKMTSELTQKGNANKTGLLGIFQTDEEGDEATENNVEKMMKDEEENDAEKVIEKAEEIEVNDVEKSTTKKEDNKEGEDKKGGTFSLLQFSTFLKQQKSLLQKLANLGNTPIFDPEKFNQLLKAAPAILAWQKAGSPVPTGAGNANASTANQANTGLVNGATPADGQVANTAPQADDGIGEITEEELEKSNSTAYENTIAAQREKVEDIEKNMGIDLEGTTKKEEDGPTIDTKKMAEEVDSEGFLESTVSQQEEAPAAASNGIMAEDIPQKSSAELAKEAKMKKDQEKAWAEEAKKREKMLEEKRKEAKANEGKKTNEKVKFKMPKTHKKMGFMATVSHKIAFFGMGKLKDEFIDNLGVMMDAGLPLLDALRTLEMETKVKPYKKILSKIVVAVETGSPLWRAMESTYFFEGQQIAMIKVGEQAGNLTENLQYLAEQSAKQRELKAKVKTAMIYPIIVGVMLTLIIFGLGMFVLPNLIQVIYSLGVPLPLITRIIVSFTNLFSEHGTVLLPSVIGGFFLLLMLHKYTSFNIVTQFLIMKVPGIGTLVRESVLSQFGVTVGGLLQAGVPITDALESLANVTTIAKYKKFYYLLLQRIRLGDSFATAFSNIKLTDKCFPTSMQQLIKTGEKSGSLTNIMMKISDIHEKKASDVAEKLPVILEPMLLMFIGTLVGGIALGVLAPIYSIVGNVG